ncbi:hypothetical protein PCYB_041420, partial [Plasmodium cynomolgi strain B]
HLLKRTIQNFHNVRHLLGRNDPVYADLARVFSQKLQAREDETLHRLEEDESNGPNSRYDQVEYLPSEHIQRGNDTLDIVDLMHLFNFYTSIEWHRFNFLILILRCIIRMGSMANTNQEMCAKFLKSCVNLRIEIKKFLKSQKGGSIFRLHKETIHWGKFNHLGLIPNRVPSIRVSPYEVKRLSRRSSPRWGYSSKGMYNTIKSWKRRGKNALILLPTSGRRIHHFEETYAKWIKRKFKLEMEVCNGLIEQCAYLVLGGWGQLNGAHMKCVDVKCVDVKCVKMLRRGGLYLNGGDSLKAQLTDYINAKCEYLPPDELLTAVDYLTKAREEAKRGTKVDPKARTTKLTRAITRISQHLCSAIQKGTNEYTVEEVCKVLSLCARNRHYDENLLDGITAFIVDNLDQVSSRRLTRVAINMHDKLGYTRNELLLAIVNRYSPPRRRGASRGGTRWERSGMTRGKRTEKTSMDKTEKTSMDKTEKTSMDKTEKTSRDKTEKTSMDKTDKPWRGKIHAMRQEGNPPPETLPRRNFQNVKISQLLRFVTVLIKNDIHLDEEWTDYFLSLIKGKFTYISRGDFPLLCYAMLHMQSREIILNFFNPSSRYHIYKYFPMDELAKSLRLTPLIQIVLLLSMHIHRHNRRTFFCFFFNVLKKFCLQSDIPHESAQEEECSHGGAFTGMSSSPHVENDQSGKNVKPELSVYVHNLNVYERGNNNKYDKKKKQHVQNQIAKIPIPTCEQMKEEIIPFIKLTPPDYQLDVILDETDELSSNHGGKTTRVYTVTTPGGAAPPNQQNSVKENCPPRVTSPRGGESTHRGDSLGDTNHPHLVVTCNTVATAGAWRDTPAKGLPRQPPLRENNLPSDSGGRTESPLREPPMKKQTYHESDYFENVANARNVLWAIQIVLLHLAEEHPNGCLEDGSGRRCLSSRLNELTLSQLSLLHRTYALCCSYIDSSLSEQRSLNNERVVSSSRFHKQVLSILAQVVWKEKEAEQQSIGGASVM